MAFVNEKISESDRKKYHVMSLGGAERRWTVDKNRDMYLQCVRRGGREIELSRKSIWHFLWYGSLFKIQLHLIDARGKLHEVCWSHKKVDSLQKVVDPSINYVCESFPVELRAKRDLLFKDFKDALLKEHETDISCASHELLLEVELKGDGYQRSF